MVPHIQPEDRSKVINSFKRVFDGDTEVSSAIIEKDREGLRAILSKNYG